MGGTLKRQGLDYGASVGVFLEQVGMFSSMDKYILVSARMWVKISQYVIKHELKSMHTWLSFFVFLIHMYMLTRHNNRGMQSHGETKIL